MRSQRFQALVAQQPDNVMFRFSLAQALVEENCPADAIPHLEFCARARADWMMARILWGKALVATGQPDAARPILAEALALAVAQEHETPEAEVRALLDDLSSRG